jgi:hypothetical protein
MVHWPCRPLCHRGTAGKTRRPAAREEHPRREETPGRIASSAPLPILPAVYSRAWLAVCYPELGTFAEGRALGEQGVRIAEVVAHPASRMYGYWGLGLLSLRQGDLLRALPLLERAVGICQEADLPVWFPGWLRP